MRGEMTARDPSVFKLLFNGWHIIVDFPGSFSYNNVLDIMHIESLVPLIRNNQYIKRSEGNKSSTFWCSTIEYDWYR